MVCLATCSGARACSDWIDLQEERGGSQRFTAEASVRVFHLAAALRNRGHLAATLDPLRGKQSRQLSPKEPVHWRIGGKHGQKIPSIDVNRCLGPTPGEH
ncbi:unnamed protein product [Durusdinium trenchii]|uniref:Uncharacterized protein n=1 Tax=Durusdinium trenchii TaxID=1381693 RepID=A0ABP0H7N6_9DINO